MKVQARHGSRTRCIAGDRFRSRGPLLAFAGSFAFLLAALMAVRSAEAQPFHRDYGRADQSGGLTSVAPTQAPGAIASGYFNVGHTQGVLLNVQPDGAFAWAKGYGIPFLSMVRQTAAGTFVWVGVGILGSPSRVAPVVAEVDPTGAVLWSHAIDLPLPNGASADQAYGRFLEIDPRDGGSWVGGELYRQAFTTSEPWIAKLDRSGKLLWAKVVSFPESAHFLSIFPALDGGVIGVGQIWLKDAVGALQSRMLAVKLRADGSMDWAFGYLVHNADPSRSRQWLADLDRDSRFTLKQSAVVGTVTDFCKSLPSVPCDTVRSAAFVATLDEATGQLTQSVGLYSLVQSATTGETIAMDLTQEVNAVGGEVQDGEIESREGLLALLGAGNRIPRAAMLYGDGSGPLVADLGSLSLYRNAPERGYLFLMNEIDFVGPQSRERQDLVQTDLAGKSGACESKTAVATFEAYLDQFGLQPTPRNGKQMDFPLEATPAEMPDEPCKSCPPEPDVRTAQASGPGAGASKATPYTVLPGIPGASEGQRANTPLVVLPLKP